jgi:hypothetical protein
MSRANKILKPKRKSRAVPMLGAAGLSLSLVGGASAATGGMADMPTRATAAGHEIALAEEEICGVSLATFHAFDKESGSALQTGRRLAIGGCGGCGGCGCGACGGCWTGTDYTSSVFGGSPVHRLPRPTRLRR